MWEEEEEGLKAENQEMLVKIDETRNRNLQLLLKVVKQDYGN